MCLLIKLKFEYYIDVNSEYLTLAILHMVFNIKTPMSVPSKVGVESDWLHSEVFPTSIYMVSSQKKSTQRLSLVYANGSNEVALGVIRSHGGISVYIYSCVP